MKKTIVSICIVVCAVLSVSAQSDSLLRSIAQKQFALQRTSTRILAGWSVANLAISGMAIGKADGSARYFHEMNLYWNAVNAGIAGLGLLSLRKSNPSTTVSSVVKEHYTLQKTLLFNTGLDVAYVTSGLWLLDKSKTEMNQTRGNRFRGFGQAVVIQGGFLLVFDLTNYFIHRADNPRLHRFLDKVALNSNGVVIKF
jgi:hypothetical protein